MPSSPRPRLPLWLAITGAVVIGTLTAVQARVNGLLGARLDDGFVAAAISFGSGLILMIVVCLALPEGRKGFRTLVSGLRGRTIPRWMVLGGLAGAFTVSTQGLTAAIIGVSLFTVGVIAGQALCGLIIDRVGFGPAGVVALTLGRVAGALLALAAVAVSLAGDALTRVPWWMLVMPFAAGIGIAWQQAVNGRLRAQVGTPLTATLVNFIGGTAVLLIAAVIAVLVMGPTEPWPSEPWLYLGGTMGVIYIFLGAAIVARTGVLLLGLGSVVGQIVTSAVIDLIWPVPGAGSVWQAAIMIALALSSVIVAAVPWGRRARR